MLGPIDTIRIFTGDITGAIPFYRDVLGMKLAVEDDAMAVFDTGGTKLMLEALDPDDEGAADLVGRFTGLSFAVGDIRAAFAGLSERGASFDGRPEIQPWGGALAHFFDPDGNVLTLVQYPQPEPQPEPMPETSPDALPE